MNNQNMKKRNILNIFPFIFKGLIEKENHNSQNAELGQRNTQTNFVQVQEVAPLKLSEFDTKPQPVVQNIALSEYGNNDFTSGDVTPSDYREPEKLKKTKSSKVTFTSSLQRLSEEGNGNGERTLIPRYLELMLEKGIIDEEIFTKSLEIHQASSNKKRLVDILIDDCNVDRELVYKSVALSYSFDQADVSVILGNKEKLQFIKKVLHTLPAYYYEMAVRRKILPFEFYSNGYDKLTVVTPDVSHPDVHTVARSFNYKKYQIKYISVADWNELWRQLAFDQGLKQLGLDVDEDFVEINRMEYENELEHAIEDEVGNGKLVELIESILVDGVRTGASDIHIIPKGAFRTEFYFRIDGRLSLWSTVTDVRAEAILAVTKDRGKNLDRFEKFLSQDGFAQRTIDNQVIRFRFSTMPIYGGDLRSKLESIVIRILRGAEVISGIDALGMDEHTKNLFLKAIRKTQGMIITTGPTGSGKSTTQVAALKTIMDPSVNIITIEDPVEYLLEGCRQVKLNHKLDFEGALRGLLRHDPDIVVVGEMRDRVTADMAVKLANTGHLIFSTLHTNDSASAITRLFNMGVEPFLLAYTINLILAQRLVRKLCDRCKEVDENVDIGLLNELGFTDEEIRTTKFYRPVGCIRCIKGFRGRVGIFEALHLNKEIRQTILKSKDIIDEDAIRTLAIKNGMRTLRQSSIDLVKRGITSLSEIIGIAIED